MQVRKVVLLLVLILISVTVVKGQKTKKRDIVKLATSGLTISEASKGDSVKYYAVYLANVVKFMDEDRYNYSRIRLDTKEDVLAWFDEAINASNSLKENPDQIIYGEKAFYKMKSKSIHLFISTNNNSEEYFKCTTLLLEKAKNRFIKKTSK